MNKNIILNHQEVEHKIKRIAYQIYETFADEDEIILAGIASNGYIFAEKICTEKVSVEFYHALYNLLGSFNGRRIQVADKGSCPFQVFTAIFGFRTKAIRPGE